MSALAGMPYFHGIQAARCDWCGGRPVAHWYFSFHAPPRHPCKACAVCGAWGLAQVVQGEYDALRQRLDQKAEWSDEDLAAEQVQARVVALAWREYSALKAGDARWREPLV